MDFVDNYNKPLSEPEYKFDEDRKLKSTLKYIQSTYDKHYSMGSIQSTEFIADSGHIEGFCIGNIIKYAQRYGKKEGEGNAEIDTALRLARRQNLPFFFAPRKVAPPKRAALPRQAAAQSDLKTLLEAFDIPEPVL